AHNLGFTPFWKSQVIHRLARRARWGMRIKERRLRMLNFIFSLSSLSLIEDVIIGKYHSTIDTSLAVQTGSKLDLPYLESAWSDTKPEATSGLGRLKSAFSGSWTVRRSRLHACLKTVCLAPALTVAEGQMKKRMLEI